MRSCVRPVCATDVAAGHNALRGSGPNRKHAFKEALTHTGSPDPRIDLICITSSCPRQFVKTLSSISSMPLSAVPSPPWIAPRFSPVLHFDAAEWAPSTASKADMTLLNFDVHFTPNSGHPSAQSKCPLWARSGHCKLLHTHSGTGPEFNDGDECNQNKDRQCHGLRDRERRFRLYGANALRAETFTKLCTTRTKTFK